jgi:Putative zinc-finger
MSQNFASPAPVGPRALCATYAPLLPLLPTGGLTPDEARAVHEHLAECTWCRARLVEYNAVYAALRRHVGPDTIDSPVPTVSEVVTRSEQSLTPVLQRFTVPQRSVVRTRWHGRFPIGAIAAVLLVALFGALLLWQRDAVGNGQQTLDPQAHAYVSVLRAYYQSVLDALGAEGRQCITAYDNAPAADKLQDMLACRPMETAVVTASQTLLTRLAMTQPPPRWQSADRELKQWAQELISAFTHRLQAIDAHDTTRFAQLVDTEIDSTSALSCAPIQRINADLPADNQLPVSASGICGP